MEDILYFVREISSYWTCMSISLTNKKIYGDIKNPTLWEKRQRYETKNNEEILVDALSKAHYHRLWHFSASLSDKDVIDFQQSPNLRICVNSLKCLRVFLCEADYWNISWFGNQFITNSSECIELMYKTEICDSVELMEYLIKINNIDTIKELMKYHPYRKTPLRKFVHFSIDSNNKTVAQYFWKQIKPRRKIFLSLQSFRGNEVILLQYLNYWLDFYDGIPEVDMLLVIILSRNKECLRIILKSYEHRGLLLHHIDIVCREYRHAVKEMIPHKYKVYCYVKKNYGTIQYNRRMMKDDYIKNFIAKYEK